MHKVHKVTEWGLQMVTKHRDMFIPKCQTQASLLKQSWLSEFNLSLGERWKIIIIPGLVAMGTQWLEIFIYWM